MTPEQVTPEQVCQQLAETLRSVTGELVLGFSGGLDSSVLLAALCHAGLAKRVHAVHVHHGLAADADHWREHCRRQAQAWPVRFSVVHVQLPARGNLEAEARQLRRAALIDRVGRQDALLLAHHRHDQAETVLLRLLRAAGTRGLAAMAPRQQWQGRVLLRPLLDTPRSTLEALARHWQLDWLEDPANQQLRFDRNYLRHRLWPVLAARWPQADARLAESAALLTEQAWLLDELAQQDLKACAADRHSLSLPAWLALSPPRQRNLIYGWCRQRGLMPPPASAVARIASELAAAQPDRQPQIRWPDGVFARFRQRLWLLTPAAWQPLAGVAEWLPASQPVLQLDGVTLRLEEPGDLCLRAPSAALTVRAARGGERIRRFGHHREISELWRRAAVPPWQRRRLPLLFVGDELVAAAAAGVADRWQPVAGEAVFHIAVTDSAL